jgi:hypothetical protein
MSTTEWIKMRAKAREKMKWKEKVKKRTIMAKLSAQSQSKKIRSKRTWAKRMKCSPDPMSMWKTSRIMRRRKKVKITAKSKILTENPKSTKRARKKAKGKVMTKWSRSPKNSCRNS